jgi:hypothetical protein
MAAVSGEQLRFLDDDQAIARWWLWACRLAAAVVLYVLVFGSLMILITPSGALLRDGAWMLAGLGVAYLVYSAGLALGARWQAR